MVTPLQPSPNATTTANANIAKKPTIFPSLLRKTKATPNKRWPPFHKPVVQPPVTSIAYHNDDKDHENNNDHHSRISELTYERILPAVVVGPSQQQPHESDMSSLSQTSVQQKAKRMRRQKKVQTAQEKGTFGHHKIMDLQKVQPQLAASHTSQVQTDADYNDDETNNKTNEEVMESTQKTGHLEHVLPTIFSATTPQSQKELTPVADNRGGATVVEQPSVVPVREEEEEEADKEIETTEPEKAADVAVEQVKPEEGEEGTMPQQDDAEESTSIHNNKKFDKVKALLHRMNPLDRVKALQKNAPKEMTEDAIKATWLQALEENKPKILLSRETKASPPDPVHVPEEPPATLHQPSRRLAEPHPEIDGIVSLVELDGPRPPNAPTPVHRRGNSSDKRRTSFEPPDSVDEMQHHIDAPSRDAPVDDDGVDGDVEDDASQEFFHGMLKALEPAEKPTRSMRQRLFQRNFPLNEKEEHVSEVNISSSVSEENKPAVDITAMMAALESTLPPRPKRERKKKGSSPRRSPSADSPRRRQQKFAKKASKKAEQLQQSRKQHPVETKTERDVKQEKGPTKEAKILGELVFNPKASSSHSLTATPSLPRNIVLSEDSLISDLDQSIRNFPMRQIVARPDLEGLSSLEWTKHNSDSEEDELTEDRYAITEDRYIPISPASFNRPITPRSPVPPPPLHILQSYTNPDKLGDALADSITEWSVDNTAHSGDTAEMALEVVLNTCNQTPFGQICIRDTKTFPSKECFTSENVRDRDASQRQGVRFAEEDNFVNKIFGMIAASGYDKDNGKGVAQEKTPLTSNRHFFGETEEDQTQDSAPSRESKVSQSEGHQHPMRCFTNVPTGPVTPHISRSADAASKHGKDGILNEHKHDDASGRYTAKSSNIGIRMSEASGDDSDEDDTQDRYSVSKSAKSNTGGGNESSVSSPSEARSQAEKSFSFDNSVHEKDVGSECVSKAGDDCGSSTASPLRPEESDKRAQRDDASFRAKIINRLGLDDQSLGVDTSVHLFSKVSSLHDDNESFDLAKYVDDKGDEVREKLRVSTDCNVEETPSLKQRLLSFGKQVIAMSPDKKLKVQAKINKLKPSAKGVLIRSIDRANPDIIDLTNIQDSDDLEDMEAVWLFDLSPKQVGAVHSILTFANDEHRENLTNVEMVDKYQPVEIDETNNEVEIVQGTPADINASPGGKVVVGKSFSPKEETRNADVNPTEPLQENEEVHEDTGNRDQGTDHTNCQDGGTRKSKTKPGILDSLFEQAEALVCGGNAYMLGNGEDEVSEGQTYLTQRTEPPSLIFANVNSPSSTFSTECKGGSTGRNGSYKAAETNNECFDSSEKEKIAVSTESQESAASRPEEKSLPPLTESNDHDTTLSEKKKIPQPTDLKESGVEKDHVASSQAIVEHSHDNNQLIVLKTGKDLLDAIFEQTETLICGDELPKLPALPVESEVEVPSDRKDGKSNAVIDLTNLEDSHCLLKSEINERTSGVTSENDARRIDLMLPTGETHTTDSIQPHANSHSCPSRSRSSDNIAPPVELTNHALPSTESERIEDVEMVLSHGESMGIDFDEDSLPDSALQLMLFSSPANTKTGGKIVQPPKPENLINRGLRHKQLGPVHNGEILENKARAPPRPEARLPSKKEHISYDGKSTSGPRPETFVMRKQTGQYDTSSENGGLIKVNIQEESLCVIRDEAVCGSSENAIEIHDVELKQQQDVDKVDFVTSITCALFGKGKGWITESARAEMDTPETTESASENLKRPKEVLAQAEDFEGQSSSVSEETDEHVADQHAVIQVRSSNLSHCSEDELKDNSQKNIKEVQSIDKNVSIEPADASLSPIKCGLPDVDEPAHDFKKLVVNTEQDSRAQPSSHQLLDSSSEESLQLITESNLPTISFEKSHSVLSSAEESPVDRGESLLSTSRSFTLPDSKNQGKHHLRSFSVDTVESKVNDIETIDPIIGPTSTVSASASSVPVFSYAVSSEVDADVSVPPIVGPSPICEGESRTSPAKFTFAVEATALAKENGTIDAIDVYSPRIESQSSSFSLEATGAEVNSPFKLPVIEENRKEEEMETGGIKEDLDILMRVLSSGSFDRGFERMYSDRNKTSVILGVSVPCETGNLIVVQGEEVITGTIAIVDAIETEESLPTKMTVDAIETEEPLTTKMKERIEVSGKPVVQSQIVQNQPSNTIEKSILDDSEAVDKCSQLEVKEGNTSVDSTSKIDLDLGTCEPQSVDKPSTAVITSDALNNSELADVAPFSFFPCSIPTDDGHVAHILPKEVDGIDPCGALGITTRTKKDASPTFAGIQPRSASAPRPRTSPILEQKPQMYTSTLMKKLQQRKQKRDEIRSNNSFSRRSVDSIEHKASLSGVFSLTSNASSKSTYGSFESNDKVSANHQSSDPPSSQQGHEDIDYALMEIVSDDDSSTEADGSSLLLALTRSEGEEPLMISPKSAPSVSSPSSQTRGVAVKESASEKTEPVRNTATPKAESDAVQMATNDEGVTSEGDKEATQSASLRKTLDRIRANSSKSVSGDMSVLSSDTDPVDIDRLFSRYDNIVKNMVVLDDQKLSHSKINKDVEIIDVTDQRSEQSSTSGGSFLSELPKRLSSIGNDHSQFAQHQPSTGYRSADTVDSEDEVIQVTSFGSENTTPSEKARSLRYQLDQALKASAAIRNSQERLGVELHTFKNRLQLQRRELSPVRDQQSSSGYSHHSSMATASRGKEQRQSRQATSTSRQYYEREREHHSIREEELLDRVENDRAKTYSPRAQQQQQRQTYALADDDDDDEDEEDDDLFDFDESSEDELEIDSAASSNEVKFQQLQSILKGLRQNEEQKVKPRPYY